MTRMTPELGRLAAARPESARHAAALTDEGERQTLLAAIMADEQPQRSRERHLRWLMPVPAAVASALAVSRRHRQIAFAATVTVAVTAGAALAVAALIPAGQQASHQPTAQLADWTVSKLADGNFSVRIRKLIDPAGLQRELRADGVPASVTFPRQLNPACWRYPAGQAVLRMVFLPPPGPVVSLRPNSRPVWFVIDPSALPGGTGVRIAVPRMVRGERVVPGERPPSSGRPLFDLVYASSACTGS